MVWLKRGLCGSSLKTQSTTIGAFYTGGCIGCLVYAFIIFSNFTGYVQQKFEETRTKALSLSIEATTTSVPDPTSFTTINFSNDSESSILTTSAFISNLSLSEELGNSSSIEAAEFFNVSSGSYSSESDDFNESPLQTKMTSEEKILYQEAVNYVLQYSFTIVAFAVISLIASVYLMLGASKSKILYFVPWILEMSLFIFVGGIVGLSRLLSNQMVFSGFHTALLVLLYFFSVYSCYAVISHVALLRKMARHSTDIISSVMPGEGYSGSVNFEKLQELANDLELQEVGPGPVLRQSKNYDDFKYFSIS